MRARVADYIVDRIKSTGTNKIFFVPGTGCMYLIDAIIRNKQIQGINMHHEQAAGMAALTYGQINNSIGACFVTTGCGGTNAITALLHAWQDNIPCVFVSGQAGRDHTVHNSKIALRQMGRQETDIVKIVSSICKYAVMLNDINECVYEIEKALYIANEGRKGPVWIDVPMDIQNTIIESDNCKHFESPKIEKIDISKDIDFVVEALNKSSRPVILAGNGIRLANAITELKKCAHTFDIPVVCSRLGQDLLETDDPLFIGMVGMLGASRAGNFCIQNSDLILCVGCRLSINLTGEEYHKFAREAKLIVVDIDENEHKKDTVTIDKFIKADAKDFFDMLLKQEIIKTNSEWIDKVFHWKKTMPVYIVNNNSVKIDMYDFVDKLSDVIPSNAIVISDAGNAFFTVTPGIRIHENQRSITSAAQAEMGYALPGSIGAAFASNCPICVVNGDGSIMMNLQELATISYYKLPIKIFVLNNNGHGSVRQMHQNRFRRYIGCDAIGGLGLPDMGKIANGFDIPYKRIIDKNNLKEEIHSVFEAEGPMICEVMCSEKQDILMVTGVIDSKKNFVVRPLEDQSPFLPREVFLKEMIIEPIDQ